MEEQSCATTSAATNGGPLETSKSDRAVWLMKCPPVVSRSLQSSSPPPIPDASSDSSLPVAKVIVSIDPLRSNDDPSARQFTMELASTGSGNIPKCYSMDMSTDFIPMSVFCESSEGMIFLSNVGKLSVEGKIYHKFDMKPHNENIEEYGKLCRERTNKYMTKSRQIQVIDNDNGSHMRPMPGMIGFKTSAPTEKKKVQGKSSEVKRTRRDRGEMEEIMFNLFERQSNWTLKQLLNETDQPEQFLKDMLKDLCIYNNKGSNQGSYELKPEYKKSVEETDPKT